MYQVEKLFKGQWVRVRRTFASADQAEAYAMLLGITLHDTCRVVVAGSN